MKYVNKRTQTHLPDFLQLLPWAIGVAKEPLRHTAILTDLHQAVVDRILILEWETRNGERGMGNEEWGTRNGKRGMGNEEWGTRNGKRGMGNEEWGTRNGNEEWGTRNGERGMGNEEWGTRNGEQGTGMKRLLFKRCYTILNFRFFSKTKTN